MISSVASRSRGRSMEEAADRLRVELTMAGLHPPTTTWLDAVAREAVLGHSYVVSTDADLVDRTVEREALEDAPAELAISAPTGDQTSTVQSLPPWTAQPEDNGSGPPSSDFIGTSAVGTGSSRPRSTLPCRRASLMALLGCLITGAFVLLKVVRHRRWSRQPAGSSDRSDCPLHKAQSARRRA